MRSDGSSLPIERFIADHIDSVHTLEILLILAKDSDEPWSVERIHTQVKSSHQAVASSLARLVETGLVKPHAGESEQFQFCPQSVRLRQGAAELAALYASRSAAVIELIYSGSRRSPEL